MIEVERLLTPAQVGEILGVGRNAAYDLLNSRGFPAIRLGRRLRVRPQALEQWLQDQEGAK